MFHSKISEVKPLVLTIVKSHVFQYLIRLFVVMYWLSLSPATDYGNDGHRECGGV